MFLFAYHACQLHFQLKQAATDSNRLTVGILEVFVSGVGTNFTK